MKKSLLQYNAPFGFLHAGMAGVEDLVSLALDTRWSWNHEADEIWKELDPQLWDLTNNPWIVLQTISGDRLEKLLEDTTFRKKVDDLRASMASEASASTWFRRTNPEAPLTHVAYFSMEYMLSEALPIYVGGLGNVAGDQLKSANDLGVPVTAVGLLYQQGYFRQQIAKDGSQIALYPYNDPGQLPITPVRLPNGEWLRLKVDLPGYPVWLRSWQVRVGNLNLYLLDSNDAANYPVYRSITSEIYGGGPELRIQQEILLGIGGWRLLKVIGIRPEVCHMNEGHAAFLVLDRARDFMEETGCSFDEALAVTRAGNLFTTHTAVAAGFDHFSPWLMEQFLGDYAKKELKIPFDKLLSLGRADGGNPYENFNMAYLAIRGSGGVNGVSRLHGEVSRNLFEPIFPRTPEREIPIGYVTNGVHVPSWHSEHAEELWTRACGKDWWKGDQQALDIEIEKLPDATLWQFRNRSRADLIEYIRQRFEREATIGTLSGGMLEREKFFFNPDVLTLGFARRFVLYKRPSLLLYDEQRFIRLLRNKDYPVQLILAGKAPPADESGKALIRQWIEFIHRNNLQDHVIFLSDYDMFVTEKMVQGVDVWINVPRRPWEACGTSGMKVLVNGGLNLSELDGWWAEAYREEVGWALGDGKEHHDDPSWDAVEAAALYDLLEKKVVPEFYSRNREGIPAQWVAKMRKSMSDLTLQFSANRTVREYTEKYYIPAAREYRRRADEKGAVGTRIVRIAEELKNNWQQIKLDQFRSQANGGAREFYIEVSLGHVSDQEVQVELYADALNGQNAEQIAMERGEAMPGDNRFLYHAKVNTARPAEDYTVRVRPQYEKISVPLENNLILWQR